MRDHSRVPPLQAEVIGFLARPRMDDLDAIQLAEEESDAATLAEAQKELKGLSADIEILEIRTLLSGDYDQRDALVTIRSEAGGVDAADFAAMLLRMYLRWAERHNYSVEVYDISYAEEAGIKSATLTVREPFAYGILSVEQGTHRLVRISPFDNQGRRQTSFAGVEVLPVTEETDHIDIPEADIRVDVFRSSGPGGQSVNTTDSAVRITHLPTGLVVSCQNEKSQLQNKAAALRVLQSRLLERARPRRKPEMKELQGGRNSWGSQMRSYVLHPYQMVKTYVPSTKSAIRTRLRRRHRRIPGRRRPLASPTGGSAGALSSDSSTWSRYRDFRSSHLFCSAGAACRVKTRP